MAKPMRVLLANHTPLHGSGSGVHTQRLAEELERQGHRCALLTPAERAPRDGSVEHHRIGVPSSPGRWTLPFPFPSFSGHADSARLYGELADAQVDAYVATWSRALVELCAELHPDVIHVNHAFLIARSAQRVAA